MITPFANDIFALIWKAFKNLYPDKECECFWEPQIRDDENGNEVLGLTDFCDDGSVVVFVRPDLEVAVAGEILAHELAHVAVGVGHMNTMKHGKMPLMQYSKNTTELAIAYLKINKGA